MKTRQGKQASKNRAYLSIILVSVAFAAAMLISSTIFTDRGDLQTVIFLLIALWFVPFFYFIKIKEQSSN